jgi:hypothetical protein
MSKYPGRIIKAAPPAVSLLGASGIWKLKEIVRYIKNGTWPSAGALDPNFNQTVLLLHGDGNQGANNLYNPGPTKYLAFADNSNNNFPITVQGDAYGSTFSPYEGNYSNYFDGAGDFLTTPSNSAFDFGTGDFTVEFWAYVQTTSGFTAFVGTSTGDATSTIRWRIYIESTGSALATEIYNTSNASIGYLPFQSAFPRNQWVHCALVRNGTSFRLYQNGVQSSSSITSSAAVANSSTVVRIGDFDGSIISDLNGYLSNVRIVKGTAVYTSAFTPPTAPLTAISGTSLLTCQSNRFIDNSTNNFTITRNGDTRISPFQPFTLAANDTGSGYFDGSGDFLDVPDSAALEIGSNSFCIEAWINPSALPTTGGERNILAKWITASRSFAFLYFNSSGTMTLRLSYSTDGSTTQGISQSAAITANTWQHIAITRDGTTARFFLNGVQQGSNQTLSGAFWDNTEVLTVGRFGTGGGSQFNGYLSDLRFVVGSPVYTSNFTPPTAPVTNITNTQLLTCQYSGSVRNVGFIDSSPNYFPITRVGNTTQGTFSPFSLAAGQWSNYFDGNGDFLSIDSSASPSGTEDFCVELWYTPGIKPSNYPCIFSLNTTYNVTTTFSIYDRHDAYITKFSVFGCGINGMASTTTVTPGVTYHIAVTRNLSGGVYTLRLFVNGVLEASQTGASGSLSSNSCFIGRADTASLALSYLNGYVSNFRIVRGSSVYTSAFTPSTTPLTAITNTSLLTCQSNRFFDANTQAAAKTITANGDVRVTPFSPFAPTAAYSPSVNGGGGYFDGTGDYLTIADNPALRFGTGNFTIQCWLYRNVNSQSHSVGGKGVHNSTGWAFLANNTNTLRFSYGTTTLDAGIVPSNSWTHVAVVREGLGTDQFKFYIDGVQVGQATVNYDFNQTEQLIIGANRNLASLLNGYMAGLKITVGTAETITLPTVPPTGGTALLNFTNAGIFDQTGKNVLETVGNAQVDTNVRKFGTGSMKFDGTDDRLVMPSNPELNLSSGNFTIEAWVYWTGSNANAKLLSKDGASGSSYAQYNLGMNGSGYMGASIGSGNGVSYIQSITSNTLLPTNQWVHIAFVKNGTNLSLYQNGTSVASATQSGTMVDGAKPLLIGYETGQAASNYWNGFIDDLRITKGVARYTLNFTPPAQAFPDK